MIYLLLGAVCAFFGMSTGLGATTLLRPVLDAVSPLAPQSAAAVAAMATLCAALVGAFFALSQPLALPQEELLFIAAGAALGGVLGDLGASRFFSMVTPAAASLLQNALLFTLIALPSIYFGTLAHSLSPLILPRIYTFPAALAAGLAASFLSFGAEPLTLMLCFVLLDMENDESHLCALTVALFSMAGKLVTLLIRSRFILPSADVLIWLLPGMIIGALLAATLGSRHASARSADALLKLSLFTSLLNMAAAWL